MNRNYGDFIDSKKKLFGLITSAKQVMFYDCLFFVLIVSQQIFKKLRVNSHKICESGRPCDQEQSVRLREWSGLGSVTGGGRRSIGECGRLS